MKTALLLAGCAARGVIQAGMIQAVLDSGIEYDMLYGSSAGALNGALLHAGQLQDMKDLWLNIRNKDVYSQAPWNAVRANKGCLYDSTPLLKLIQQKINFAKLVSNPKPFILHVTEMYPEWKSIHVNATEPIDALAKLLWASASPPVLMPPVQIGTGTFTDGGLTNNYSVVDAVNAGADRLIVLAPMVPEPKPIRNIIDSIEFTISIQLWNQLERELKFVNILNNVPGYRKIEVILITADKPTGIGILDFDIKDRQKWIDYGYELAKNKLQGLWS
ncbi:MAG: patatin-like phospholipase family protein [Candidatus Obscuribacterales bacterium]|nr:patatin-like phospholipase family protein [Candidatus Obscuribacterales bacterium]